MDMGPAVIVLSPFMGPSNAIATLSGLVWVLVLCGFARPAFSWGDEGHEVVGLIADHYLEPPVRARVTAILAGDATHLTPTIKIDSESTWADKYRDSDRNSTKVHYNQTHYWHYVDLELRGPDLKSACFGEPRLARKALASAGPAEDCLVDKIAQFTAELRKPTTSEKERRFALQFILHFVGDVHQPLHASDDHDQGGNLKIVTAPGIASNNLHHDWDTEFVNLLGPDQATIAQRLIASITGAQRSQWETGIAADWAMESFVVAKRHSYGLLPAPDPSTHYALSAAYASDASAVIRQQLSKAGVRLAFVLNQSLHQGKKAGASQIANKNEREK